MELNYSLYLLFVQYNNNFKIQDQPAWEEFVPVCCSILDLFMKKRTSDLVDSRGNSFKELFGVIVELLTCVNEVCNCFSLSFVLLFHISSTFRPKILFCQLLTHFLMFFLKIFFLWQEKLLIATNYFMLFSVEWTLKTKKQMMNLKSCLLNF